MSGYRSTILPDGRKICRGCGIPRFPEAFERRQGYRDGRGMTCRTCRAEARKPAMHKDNLRKRFGISAEEYARILAAQGGRCAICRREPGERRLHVDHEHGTKVIRGLLCGLLCGPCNRGLGYLGENPDRLREAAEYVTTADTGLRVKGCT